MARGKKVPTSVAFHQRLSFSKAFSTSLKGLEKEGRKRIFFPGCSLMAYSPDIVMKTYQYLKEKLPGIGIMAGCCGKPSLAVGDREGFQKYYGPFQGQLEENHIEEIIVACSNCFMTIGKFSPKVKVTSLWEVMAKEGVPEGRKNIGGNWDVTFALHDPCPTRGEGHIHDAIREITGQLGLSIEEMEHCREKTLCCGALYQYKDPKGAQEQMKRRAGHAQSDYMISYCEECVCSMKTGGKKAIHFLDILFGHPKDYSVPFDQQAQGTITRWINRYKGKRKVSQVKNKS